MKSNNPPSGDGGKYKHLFFDLDHTLWDFEANSRQTLEELYYSMQLGSKGVNDFDLFHGLGVKCFIFDDVDLEDVRHAISDIVWLEKAQLAFFSYPTTSVLVLEQNEKHRWGGF